jgi:alpha-L-arabinofuranosidase
MRDCWREDVIDITRTLSPALMRWGGCFCSYYRWKEGVGPMEHRTPMYNLLWGGIYNNQVGTHEFVDFCRQVGADPLITVNFESDGRKFWARNAKGQDRLGNAKEAAEWVDYCNNPANRDRIGHGHREPYGVKLWQVGNETSYGNDGFTGEIAARKTVEFATAMRHVDPGIDIIAWGEGDWAGPMAEIAGEHVQYLAYHNGFHAGGEGSPLHGIEYRRDPDLTWEYLMKALEGQERKLDDMRGRVGKYGIPLALTECHFFLHGRNRNEVLSTWAAGVVNARLLNLHQRNGDVLKIATLADFCGTRWQNNAVIVPTPRGKSFMMPVAMVMSLYRKHSGEKALTVTGAPDGLDVAASRTGDRVFLHVVNTSRTRSAAATLGVVGASGMASSKIRSCRVFWFDPDPEFEVFEYRDEHTIPKEKDLGGDLAWTFPPASVSAVELDLEPA